MKTVGISLCIVALFVCTPDLQTQREKGREVTRLNVSNALQAAWSADLSKFAVLTGPEISVWEAQDWHLLYTIPDVYAYSFAWHPTENLIAVVQGGHEERLLIWDGETGDLRNEIVRQIPMDNAGVAILHTLSWNPTGTHIVSDSNVDTLVIWDVVSSTVTPLVPLEQPISHNVIEVSWSNSGDLLLTGGLDGTIRVWDVQTGESIVTVPGYKHVAWHPETTHFAGAGFDTDINIWNLETREIEVQFQEHTNTITSVNWNNNGDTLASTDADGNLYLWDFPTGDQVRLDLGEIKARNACWRPDGLQIAIITVDSIIIATW